ncbi:TPA: hypothetical protein N0F65_001898 [Lagenidium giganteum]|uniref:FYVE-type domain-containing protein n=1 Tax=Lagenidium giganteum TaxID=4803 RepID=A0AAV2YZ35_9STRA|nr:TPA: hypothetical protein N0F65_001898 [Lagenidium giganteum]
MEQQPPPTSPPQQQQDAPQVDNAAAGADEPEVEEEMPFTPEEMQTCIKVFDMMAKNPSLLWQKNFRLFRKSLAPVSEHMEARKFGGKGRKKYLEDKQLKEEKRARHNQRKMHDKRHINSSLLRRERLKKLETLLEQGKDQMLPLIADGAADDEHVLKSLCTDEEAQNKLDKEEADRAEASKLLGFRSCYACKGRFEKIHHFYDQLCPRCADLNFSKRFQTSDLRGKVALVTGARVKIGFHVALKLLLSGAAVIATTRFPRDAAERFAAHPEYETFKDRLQIFGIDFRDLIHLEQFLDFVLSRYSRLDVVIHNACQTIRRPPTYYKHLVNKETLPLEQSAKNVQLLMHHQEEFHEHVKAMALPAAEGGAIAAGATAPAATVAMSSALKSQVPLIVSDQDDESAFPEGMTDVNGQQIDLRSKNTWLLKMGEVATPEVAEVFAINTLAPFIMNNRLVPLLAKGASDTERKFIVNVSAMEGKFYRYKTPNHPHTNMAKAALNMMTRTCAEDLSKKRIYMNSVDTGWINDENPLEKAHAHAKNANFQTPIDEIDAAARILDPVFDGYNNDKVIFGKFLKDYHETECGAVWRLPLSGSGNREQHTKKRAKASTHTQPPAMKGDTRVDNKKYDLPADSKVWCANHPVLHHKLTKLRDERTDSTVFRHVLREVTFYLGYEATHDLKTSPKDIKTPLGDHKGAELSTSVAIVPILRAGLGMVDAMVDLLPNAYVHHIGMYRNKQSLLPVQYYNKLPKECNCDVAIVMEPVIATAGTIIATVAILKTWGVPKIKVVTTIASKQGLQDLLSKHPEVEVVLGAIDPSLTDEGYIFPGLGDAVNTLESRVPPLLKTRTKDPLDSSWRMHMVNRIRKDGQWVPDVAVNACMLCKTDFSFWNRKHHCRRCGAVVCYACSGNRTKFIFKDICPDKVADEEMRVCDSCIQVIDEKLAEGLQKSLRKNDEASDNQQDHYTEGASSSPQNDEQESAFLKESRPLRPERSTRAVLTMGRYRAEIKESEGNRYIRDNDL